MLSFVMIAIDQVIKYFVFMNRPQIIVIPGWLSITYAQNTGTVFGLAQGSNILFMIIAFIIIAAVLCIILEQEKKEKYSFKQKLWKIILAGGISNLIDRVCRGYVIDYVSLKFFGICNLADFFIVFGVILLAVEEIKDLVKKK